jgi:hypothetical protein
MREPALLLDELDVAEDEIVGADFVLCDLARAHAMPGLIGGEGGAGERERGEEQQRPVHAL